MYEAGNEGQAKADRSSENERERIVFSGGSRGGSLGSNEPPFFLNSAFQTLTDPAFELSAK